MTDSNFISQNILKYCESQTSRQQPYLDELILKTKEVSNSWNMLSGFYQGRLLSLLSKIQNPKNILEIGTYTGFSALCLAEGLRKDGQLTTLDISDQFKAVFEESFKKAGISPKINFINLSLEHYINNIDWSIDLVFIDAAKKQYASYLDLIKPKLSPGALIIADNVLWKGMVSDPNTHDGRALALDTFNKKINADSDFHNVLLPVRDGLMLARFEKQETIST